MIVMKGKYNVAKVMIDDIDDATREQIQGFLNHPQFGGKKKIVIMPDCHAGKGSCVGFTMKGLDYVMPQIVGVDIGCGMLAANLGKIEVDPVKLDEFIKNNIPAGHNINSSGPKSIGSMLQNNIAEVCTRIGMDKDTALRSIGSLGGGNHFVEAARDSVGNAWIVIHSGSRNFGKRIADYYQAKAREVMETYFIEFDKDMEFMPKDHDHAGFYLLSMGVAQRYARENRINILNKILSFFPLSDFVVSDYVESVHNYIDFEDQTIRKGAIRAHEGDMCIIPFNSAEGSALCRGKGNMDWNRSAPHGAGRLMDRGKAFETLDYKEYQARLAANGVYSSTANSSTLDEAPMAYKSKEDILQAIGPTVEVKDFLKPFYNFKAAEGRGRR